jgi:hypothetical protein
MNTRYFFVILLAYMISSCSSPEYDPVPKGAELLAPLKTNLKTALISGMAGGPVNAIAVCKTEAPRIAGELSVDGVVMGRSSHKLRNHENVAPAWAAPIIESFAADGELPIPTGVELGGGRYGYVEPIMTQPLCLSCHGSSLHPDIAAKISELYPNDEATGFGEGDFRGVFWVEFATGR